MRAILPASLKTAELVSAPHLRYNLRMNRANLSASEIEQARKRRLDAVHSQELEGNPLTPDEIAMFEMFEREAWPHEKCRAYILARVGAQAAE